MNTYTKIHQRNVFFVITFCTLTALARAALPTSGDGWTLTPTSLAGDWSLHADIDSALAWSTSSTNTYKWMLQGSGDFVSSKEGLNSSTLKPQAGNQFFVAEFGASSSTNRGLAIVFENLPIQAGTYTVYFKIAGVAGKTFSTPGYINIAADMNENGYVNGTSERISPDANPSRPDTSAGDWVRWSYSFTITESTSISGSSVIGKELGFIILGNAANTGFAFDDLTITYEPTNIPSIPESNTTAVCLGLFTLACVFFVRYFM